MKNLIIYTVTFIQAFILITGAFIFLNSYFVDVFHFNFALVSDLPKKSEMPLTTLSPLDSIVIKEMKATLIDTLESINKRNNLEPLAGKFVKDSLVIDSLNKFIAQIVKEVKKNPKQEKELKKETKEVPKTETTVTQVVETVKRDSAYFAWKKQTASLYEMMEPKKAAKIIQNFSDNVARDILYSMKKKKAAEILAQLNPETANRFTKAQ